MQVVPTEYRYIWKEVLPTNQFSVTEYFSPMSQNERSWPGWIYVRSWVVHFFSHGTDCLLLFFFGPSLHMQLSIFCMICHLLLSQSKKSAAVFFTSLLGFVQCWVERLLWQVCLKMTDYITFTFLGYHFNSYIFPGKTWTVFWNS